jgi:hypothetical protein
MRRNGMTIYLITLVVSEMGTHPDSKIVGYATDLESAKESAFHLARTAHEKSSIFEPDQEPVWDEKDLSIVINDDEELMTCTWVKVVPVDKYNI